MTSLIEATYDNPIKLYRDGHGWRAQYPTIIKDRTGNSRLVSRCGTTPVQALDAMLEAVKEYQGDN